MTEFERKLLNVIKAAKGAVPTSDCCHLSLMLSELIEYANNDGDSDETLSGDFIIKLQKIKLK